MLRNLAYALRSLLVSGLVAVLGVSGIWAAVRYFQHKPFVLADLSFWLFLAGIIGLGLAALFFRPVEMEAQAFHAKVRTGAEIDANVTKQADRLRMNHAWHLGGAALILWAASAGIYYFM